MADPTREQWITQMRAEFADAFVSRPDPVDVAEEFAQDIDRPIEDDPLAEAVDEVFIQAEELSATANAVVFAAVVGVVVGVAVFVATAAVAGSVVAGGAWGAVSWLFARDRQGGAS